MTLVALLVLGCQPALTAATATPVPPSSTAAPEPNATPTSSTEIVATKPSDVAGTWRFSFAGAGETFPALLILREDSTFTFSRADDPTPIFSGLLRFADGKVTFESDACFDTQTGYEPCQMAFIIHSEMENGKPLSLRFESVDASSRRFSINLNHKTLRPAVP
jgi:hypothetical protein